MSKVNVSLDDLRALAVSAARAERIDQFVGLALEWAEQANAEIERLRATQPSPGARETAAALMRSGLRVQKWFGDGCVDVDIPRVHIAVLVEFALDFAEQMGAKP